MDKRIRVLLIEDTEADRIAVLQSLPESEFDIDIVLNPQGKVDVETGLEFLRRKQYDVILLDLAWTLAEEKVYTYIKNLSDVQALGDADLHAVGGLRFLEEMKSLEYATPVVVLTGFYSDNTVKLAMRRGAGWVIQKPIDPAENILRELLRSASRYGARDKKANALEHTVESRYKLENIIGKSKVVEDLFRKIKVTASSRDLAVLIQGETGTGKELVAGAIHLASPRRSSPFMVINCPTISDTLFESELFGHKKGAFTNALQDKHGKLEVAEGGTVFLDEVADLSPSIQGKLLRFLETKELEPVGTTEKKKVDVRIIAATMRDLRECIEHGEFRRDLYYRLEGTQICVPLLRERKEDVPLLANHFISKYSKTARMKMSAGACALLTEFEWPGNIRQLRNAMHHAVTYAEARGSTIISFEDLPENVRGVEPVSALAGGVMPGARLPERVQEIEKYLVIRALDQADWNRKEAAELLGISTDQMKKLIAKHNLQGIGRSKREV